jgi:hypothetical protein
MTVADRLNEHRKRSQVWGLLTFAVAAAIVQWQGLSILWVLATIYTVAVVDTVGCVYRPVERLREFRRRRRLAEGS